MENNTLCNRHSLGVNNHTKMYVTYTRIYGWSDYGGESSYQPGYRLENMMWMTLLVYDYIIPGDDKVPIYNEFGYITIDDARIDETCNAYFKWKDLNTYISNNSHRGINMPDAISEPMGCYCLGLLWNRGDEVGDATDPNTGKKIEFKATSRFEGDLSSFGPKCVFDDLVFLRFKLDENLLYIYDLHINSDQFGQYPANQTQTIQDQKNQGRRPHVSLQSLFVNANNLQPDIIFDIRRCRIIQDNR